MPETVDINGPQNFAQRYDPPVLWLFCKKRVRFFHIVLQEHLLTRYETFMC